MVRANLSAYLSKRVVSDLHSRGVSEKQVRHLGGNTIEYMGYWIRIVDELKRILIIVEKGPRVDALNEGLEKYFAEVGIDENDRDIVSKRELENEGRNLVLTLTVGKINNQDKIYHAFNRQGIKPILINHQRILH